jgi:RHS repeat-associated protein
VDGGSTAQYVYDVFNQRIHVQTASATNEYVYDPMGRRVSTWLSPNNYGSEGRIYWGGQQIAYRSVDGTTYFDHQDMLGTERMRTTYSGGVGSTYTSLPWGDGYTATVNTTGADQDNGHFAGLDRDAESGTEHAQFRNYASAQGRWLAPDSYMGSYNLSNPQSMNRYAYVLNNPLSLIDPTGLDCGDSNGTEIGDAGGTGIEVGGGCNPTPDPPPQPGNWCGGASWGTQGCIPWPCGSNGVACAPGSLPGGTPPTGPPREATLSNAPSKNIAACAAKFASAHSIAGGLQALGIGSNGGIGGFLTNTFGGNTFAGLYNLGATLTSSSSTDQQVLTQMGKAYLRGPLQGIPSSLVGASGTPFAVSPTGIVRGAAVGAAFNAVTGANDSLITLSGEVGLSTVGTTAAEFATGVGEAKFALDLLTFAYGVGSCIP